MALPNIFTKPVCDEIISRIENLSPETKAQWGSMTVDQMLAHLNVPYEMTFENKHPKPGFFMRLMMKSFVKPIVINEVAYKHNNRTAPSFLIDGGRDFEKEKQRLVDYINRTQQLGEAEFDGKESHSFGVMKSVEWNNMFYKHLDHHLRQFGV